VADGRPRHGEDFAVEIFAFGFRLFFNLEIGFGGYLGLFGLQHLAISIILVAVAVIMQSSNGKSKTGKNMSGRQRKKMVREGEFIAEAPVELLDSPEGWGPYVSIQDARTMDQARVLLRKGNVEGAGRVGRVYRLVPVDV
jgi:hypothetical protein